MYTPKISIITPSYNQGEFIEETILSILKQGYENLEYIVVDGGSSDATVEILEKYSPSLSWWISEPDNGQTHALNKGFSKSTGEIMAYLNADDKYCPWTLATVAVIFSMFPEVQWLTSLRPIIWDDSGNIVQENIIDGFSQRAFYKGRTIGASSEHIGWIQQESTFWRRDLWDKVGGCLTDELQYAMDFDLWARFYEHTQLVGLLIPLGGFRVHEEQKSAHIDKYYAEAERVLSRYENPEKGYENQCKIVTYDLLSADWILKIQPEFQTRAQILQKRVEQIENLETEKSFLKKRVHNLENRIQRMENTLSWKITKPLREAGKLFK